MENSKYIFPTINLKETGINLRRIMDKREIMLKDVKKYNWCSGINMPTIDKLYVLSPWFGAIILILSILVYTIFSRMFDLMQLPAMKHSIVVA